MTLEVGRIGKNRNKYGLSMDSTVDIKLRVLYSIFYDNILYYLRTNEELFL